MIDRNKSYFYQHENPGYIKISGQDRMDFLQRQTTNDLRLLSLDQPLVTVLTSPTGRVLDVLWVIDEGDDTYGVLTLPGQGDRTTDFLNSRIFFMDKISLENKSDHLLQVDFFGVGLADMLQDQGVNTDPNENNLVSIMLKDHPVKVLTHPHVGPRLLIPSTLEDELTTVLEEFKIQPLSTEEYQILRIESGLPAAGHELVEDYTPLEIGIRWAISDNKGCFTGQEVIARQINYDKVTKHLVGLNITNLSRENETLYAPESSQPVGTLTSAVLSPRFGPIALAVVKRPFHESGTDLFLRTENQELKAVTTELPFQ